MNYVKHNDSPRVDDTVGFIIETYDDNGVLKNPYVVEKITIYYIEKNAHKNERNIITHEFNQDLEEAHAHLHDLVQKEPSEENLNRLGALQLRMKETARVKTLSYSNALVVMETPAPIWTQDKKVHKISNAEDGKFMFFWIPKDMREGSYLIRWYWKSLEDGKTRSAEKLFTLYPSNQKVNSIYRKFVPREKYNFLFDKYIPPMYQVKTTPNDITPEVLVKLNKAVAQGLLELDDLAVGLIDIINPTYIPEGFLPAMANLFNIELRSTNPNAWRNQIKHALPLFKRKGTFDGLFQALDKAGIKLLKLTNLWQVISPYTWIDGFVIDKDILGNDIIGYLSKRPTENIELEVSIKSSETKECFILASNIITLQEVLIPESKIAVIWNGTNQKESINLFDGDVVKVRYNYNTIPEDAKNVENYIESLPLADQRNETRIKYPIKNWNVKLIEEDDPMFDLLVPEREGFHNPVTFGKIRTTFLYSEKAFNMDAYNGSLYNSNNPCDMDKDFVDPCSGGQSSKFNVHLELDQADDEKIKEAEEIITDYAPFHAILHNMKITSRTTDFVVSPIEKIKSEVKNNKTITGDKIGCNESIYCQIKHRNGKIENGKVV